jgi:hypothetical protein
VGKLVRRMAKPMGAMADKRRSKIKMQNGAGKTCLSGEVITIMY